MPTEEPTTGTAAYVPWRTLMNALEALGQHMPNRIDRSAFPGQSGAGQNQLLVAFKFLGLIGEDGKPTPALHAVAVRDEAARKTAMRRVIEDRYADLFALNLAKTTPAEFAEQMSKSYNVTGDTRLKATRFFLAAAADLGITVSPLLLRDRTKPTSNGSAAPRRRRTAASRQTHVAEPDEGFVGEMRGAAGTARSIELNSGGRLTISASLDLLRLSPQDRTFVFDLIDRLDEYERANLKGCPPPDESKGDAGSPE